LGQQEEKQESFVATLFDLRVKNIRVLGQQEEIQESFVATLFDLRVKNIRVLGEPDHRTCF
jgi:hypothetical protein